MDGWNSSNAAAAIVWPLLTPTYGRENMWTHPRVRDLIVKSEKCLARVTLH